MSDDVRCFRCGALPGEGRDCMVCGEIRAAGREGLQEGARDASFAGLGIAVCVALLCVGIAWCFLDSSGNLAAAAGISVVALIAVAGGLFAAFTRPAPAGDVGMKGCLVVALILAALAAGGFILLFNVCGDRAGLSLGAL